MFIEDQNKLAEIVRDRQACGEALVLTNGVFDLLHVGHLRYLQEARALGDALIVAVNGDDSVRRIKGPTRPLVTELERAELIDALRCVDYVTLFHTNTPVPLIEVVRPLIYVKGGDYTLETLPETPVVHGYGGRVEILGFTSGRSTSLLVEAISHSEQAAR